MIIWLPAIGLLVFGIFGLAGGEIRLTRRKTLRGQQAKVVGVICLAGAVLISPVGIMAMALMIDDSGRSPSRKSTARANTTDSHRSSHSVPPPAAPPPAPPTRRPTDSLLSHSVSPPPLPAPAQPSAAPTRRRVVVFQLLGYDGQVDAGQAAREALRHISWASATEVQVDLDGKEVVIPVLISSLNTMPAKEALQQVGFQIGGVKLTWRDDARFRPIRIAGVDPVSSPALPRETLPRDSHAAVGPDTWENITNVDPPGRRPTTDPFGPDDSRPAPAAYPSPGLAGSPYDDASRAYLRATLNDLIAGNDAELSERLGWVPIWKSPSIGLRWGLGVYVSGMPDQPRVETAAQLAHWTGVVGPSLITALQQRIDRGDFGDWPRPGDPRLCQLAILGGGNFAALRDSAANKGLDAFLMLTVTRRLTPGSKKLTVFMRCRVADVQGRFPPWTSTSINSDEVLSARSTQINPVTEFTQEILTHLDENYRLQPMPDLTPEVARKRAESLTSTTDLITLERLVELRYYHARGLLNDTDATAACDRLLGAHLGHQILLGDESQRRAGLAE